MQLVPEDVATPFGPVVVPLTVPLPAVIEVDRPPAVAVACPLREVATVHLEPRPRLDVLAAAAEPLPLVETLALDPAELPTLTELVEPPAVAELLELTCAKAEVAPIPATTIEVKSVFIHALLMARTGRAEIARPASRSNS